MKKLLFAVAVLGLTCVPRASAQGVTYTQTTHSCILTQCIDAKLTASDGTQAVMTYGAFFSTCGQQNVRLDVNWNGIEYNDGTASMVFIGSVYKGHNYAPWAVWELKGTFNNGTMTLVEHTVNFRTCAGGNNLDGFVATQ